MSNDEKFAKTIDDEELDEVAGGTANEILKDFKFMRDLGAVNGKLTKKDSENARDSFENYNNQKLPTYYAWRDFGIYASGNDGKNTYKKGGEFISRNDAMIYAMRQQNKYLNLEDYI